MTCAILEWSIKDREWEPREWFPDSTVAKRMAALRFKALCARYPNNSFRLVEMKTWTLNARIVHRDAENRELNGGER